MEKKRGDCCEECFKWGDQYGQYVFPCNNEYCFCHVPVPKKQLSELEKDIKDTIDECFASGAESRHIDKEALFASILKKIRSN